MASAWRFVLVAVCALLVAVTVVSSTSIRDIRQGRQIRRRTPTFVDRDDVHDVNDDDDDGAGNYDVIWLSRRRDRLRQRMKSTDKGHQLDKTTKTRNRTPPMSRRRTMVESAFSSRRGNGARRRGNWRRRNEGDVLPLIPSHDESNTSPTVLDTRHSRITVTQRERDPYTHPTAVSYHDVKTRNDGDDYTHPTAAVTYHDDVTHDEFDYDDVYDDDDDDVSMVTVISDSQQRAMNACQSMSCPRHKVCLLNIQGLPMCRCPTVYHCKNEERRPLCTVDGRTYRNKCLLRVDECATNSRMRVLHRGPCRDSDGRRAVDTAMYDDRQQGRRYRQRHRTSPTVHDARSRDSQTEREIVTSYQRRRSRRRRP